MIIKTIHKIYFLLGRMLPWLKASIIRSQILRICLFVTLFSVCFSSNAQKVALVLSGGGSKGVAHIGVIRALEEAGIPINYIAGTSMGAIIGGLYASGYTTDQMERMLNSPEFQEWISGTIDPKYIYYYRKPFPDASWLSFKLSMDSSVIQTQFPTSLVSPVRMDFVFQEMFGAAAAAASYDFNKLMVPFRCVAADIYKNKPSVLKSGDLASAIRASSTFPFYFKPIRIDGELMFDGGMYNNFPVDIALKDFDPDIIIGSKVSGNYPPPSDNNILSQMAIMLTERTSYELPCENSVLIDPHLKHVNVLDFKNTREFIDSGYAAAKRAIPAIRQFERDSVSPSQVRQLRLQFNKLKPAYDIDSVTFMGLNSHQQYFIAKMFSNAKIKTSDNIANGSRPSFGKFKRNYFRLLADEHIIDAYPRFHYDTISHKFNVNVKSNKDHKFDIDFGGNISSKATNEVFLQTRLNYWDKIASTIWANTYLGRFYNSFKAAGSIELPGKVPFYLEGSVSVNEFNFMQTTNTYFVNNLTPVYLKERELSGESRIGFPLSYSSKVEFAFDVGSEKFSYYQTNFFTDKDTLDNTYFDYFSPSVLVEKNTLNQKQYANSGERLFMQLRLTTGSEDYYPGSTSLIKNQKNINHQYLQFRLLFEKYLQKRGIYIPGFFAESYFTTHSIFTNYISTQLINPQFSPLPEMKIQFLQGYRNSSYLAGGMRNIFLLRKKIDFRIEGYAYTPINELIQGPDQKVTVGNSFRKMSLIFSGALVYQSPIGPVSMSANYYQAGQKHFSFFLNIGYILFNRQGLE